MPETDGDVGADTARFQAFAAERDEEVPAPWRMRADGPKIGVLIAIVAAVAILAAVIGSLLIG